MATQFYKKDARGNPVRYKATDFTMRQVVDYAKKLGIRIENIEACPFSEHDKIAWLKGVNEGFGFNVLPEPEKTLKPKPSQQRETSYEMRI